MTRTAVFQDRRAPWARGTSLASFQTAEEAIRAAKQDWRVECEYVYLATENGGQPSTSPIVRRRAIVRQDTRCVLAFVSDRYRPIQNIEGFHFLDQLSAGIKWVAAGSFKDGGLVWVLGQLPDSVSVQSQDEIRPHVLWSNYHNGSGGCSARYIGTRIACMNQIPGLLMSHGDGPGFLSFSHQGNVQQKMMNAQRALAMVVEQARLTAESGRLLLARNFTSDDLWKFFAKVLPFPTEPTKEEVVENGPTFDDLLSSYRLKKERVEERRGEIQELLEAPTNTIGTMRGTWWALYNAAVEWADHEMGRRDATNPTEHSWFGGGAKFKRKVQIAVSELTGVSM